MSEREPKPESFGELAFSDGEVVPLTADNIKLYTHMGKLAIYDHLWAVLDDKESKGVYIWAQDPPDNQQYLDLASVAVQHGIEMHIHQRYVSDGDKAAFDSRALADSGDFFPESWEE